MGALPKGCTIDDVISFPSQAAKWLGVEEEWLRKRAAITPGVIVETRETMVFHPRTYIEKKLKKGAK